MALTTFDRLTAEETTDVRYNVDADVLPCCNEGDLSDEGDTSDACSCSDETADVLMSLNIKVLELFILRDDKDEVFIE